VALIKCMNKVALDYVVEGALSKKECYQIVGNQLSWLNTVWQNKDKLITHLKGTS